MTIKEYLALHNEDDIKSIGIYKSDEEHNDIIDVLVTPISIVKHLDKEIDHVHLGIFDKTEKDIYGKDYNSKYIRACIYVKC